MSYSVKKVFLVGGVTSLALFVAHQACFSKSVVCGAIISAGILGFISSTSFTFKPTVAPPDKEGDVRVFLRVPETRALEEWLGGTSANLVLPSEVALGDTKDLGNDTALCTISSELFLEKLKDQQYLQTMVQNTILDYAHLTGHKIPLGLGGWKDLIQQKKNILQPIVTLRYPDVAALLWPTLDSDTTEE